MVFAHVGVGQHVVAQLLAVAQAGAVAQHQPGVRPQHGDVVGDGLGVGRAHADVDHGDAAACRPAPGGRPASAAGAAAAPSVVAGPGRLPARRVTTLPGSTKAM
jgi:hypothetical protein